MTKDELFNEENIICKYTSEQAIEDGILTDITPFNSKWKDGPFNFVTNNLLSKGYINEGEKQILNVPAIGDLLMQSFLIIKKESNNFKTHDSFYSGKIELPNGNKQDIFIEQNETGKFTILLPEDH